uniref:Uncharacterized protein n=1 Tax=Opuntia streptacantha TaxID=393608 RepID=A0A7C9A682_OPUST
MLCRPHVQHVDWARDSSSHRDGQGKPRSLSASFPHQHSGCICFPVYEPDGFPSGHNLVQIPSSTVLGFLPCWPLCFIHACEHNHSHVFNMINYPNPKAHIICHQFRVWSSQADSLL